jgi:hypothetical protein
VRGEPVTSRIFVKFYMLKSAIFKFLVNLKPIQPKSIFDSVKQFGSYSDLIYLDFN